MSKSQLHEVLAVLPNLEATAKKIMSETQEVFKKKPDHFLGLHRDIKMLDEARSGEAISDTKAIVTSVDLKLQHMMNSVARYYDGFGQMEATNQVAKADLVVEGKTLATGLPATYLLGMESRLTFLRSIYESIPTLQPGKDWSVDESAELAGTYKVHDEQLRTEKTAEFIVAYEATTEHPAQVVEKSFDRPVGKIKSTHTSTMWTPVRKAECLSRIDKLVRAVKKARQKANSVEVVKVSVGQAMLDYVNGK